MKKILLLLLSSATFSINWLNAYCVYNFSPNKNDVITVFAYKKRGPIGVLFTEEARHVVKPEKDPNNPRNKKCWSWKEIGRRTTPWFFRAYKGLKKEGKTHFGVIATGEFPVGGAIAFYGYEYGKPTFKVYFDGDVSKKYTEGIKTFKP